MLRLDLSRIQLEKKDLEYHKNTYHLRQNIRLHGHPVAGSTSASSKAHKRNKISKSSVSQSLKAKLSASPVKVLASEQHPDDTLISQDPVPRGSRVFWDKVLAEAGTPTRTRTTGSGNGTIFEPSDEWLETNRSKRASIEEAVDQISNAEEGHVLNDHTRVFIPEMHEVSSLDSFPATRTPNHCVTDDSVSISLESNKQQQSSRSRFSSFFQRKIKPITNTESTQTQESADVGLDGHNSDLHPDYDRIVSASQNTLHGGLLGDRLYGSRHDRRTISASLDMAAMHDDIQVSSLHSDRISPNQSSSSAVSLPLPLDSLQRLPNTPPRPPLYISHGGTSSCSAKSEDVPVCASSLPMAASPSLLSLPPRRRRTYRPRSETYSFALSEASISASGAAQIHIQPSSPTWSGMPRAMNSLSSPYFPSTSTGSPLSPKPTVHAEDRLPSTNFFDTPPAVTSLHHSVRGLGSRSSSRIELPGNPFNLSQSGYNSRSSSNTRHLPAAIRSMPRVSVRGESYRSASHGTFASNGSSPSISSHRNLSPHALPFIPRSTHARNLTPQYPLPPPFSATARAVSYSRDMPSSTPSNAELSNPQISPQTPPPSQRSMAGSIPSTPPRSTFAIYNDTRPPNTQPQTPADLNCRFPLNPFNTAPARSRTSFPPSPTADQTTALWQIRDLPVRGRATPTRPQGRVHPARMEAIVSHDGENADAITTDERESRREWNARVRIGREEQRRLERSPGLEQSPHL